MISRVATINDDQQAISGGTPGLPGQAVTSYAYNGAGMIVQENYPVPGVKLDYAGPTPGTYAGFDRFARVVDQRWARVPSPSQGEGQGEGSSVDRFAYGYDYNSNRTWRQNKVKTTGLDWAYTNDALDRLIDGNRGTLQANPDNGLIATNYKQNWNLDQAGNWPTFKWDPTGSAGWTTQSRTHNKANEILTITGTGAAWPDPVYDARGNMTFGPKPSDTSVGMHMVWDAWNRLVKVQADSGGAPGATIAEYQYDGANRRLVKLIPDGANWDRTDFYYNTNWQILEKRYDAALADKVTVATTVHEQYIWSLRYIDAPVLRDRDTVAGGDLGKAASGLDERLYYIDDANMNVTSLVDVNGAVVERYDYTPYGVVTIYDGTWTDIRTTSLYDNQVLYCGYRFDPETELYQVRNRYYHTQLGRWVAWDPIGSEGGMNLYQYVESSPFHFADPTGLVPRLGAFSGINAPYNYVERWIVGLNAGYQVDHNLSGFSYLSQGQTEIKDAQGRIVKYTFYPFHWDINRHQGEYREINPGIDEPGQLDAEAEWYAAKFKQGQFCDANCKKQPVRVIMIAPKTQTLPPDKKDRPCCDPLEFVVYWSPWDAVPNQAVLAPNNYEYWTKWGTVHAIRTRSLKNDIFAHGLSQFTAPNAMVVRHHWLRGWQDRGQATKLNVAVDQQLARWMNPNNGGYVFVCHSQGCNILMHVIQRACQARQLNKGGQP
ncbi:MAG: hypothetical protein BIFFINMI_02811 [Phycisphaerae bacterium]|nr:hypothetical protein [Phycisphaerae bacterium]